MEKLWTNIIFNVQNMKKRSFVEKRWKISIFNGKNDGNLSFLIEKRWKIIIFNGKNNGET